MVKPLIAGNWKMHGSEQQTLELLSSLVQLVSNSEKAQQVDILVCPSSLFLVQAKSLLAESVITLGAQNLCAEHAESGAYTGEHSAQMLHGLGCSHVLVGHSERRSYYAESNDTVATKALNALQHHLMPIVCVGETLAQREAEQTEAVIIEQLQAVLQRTKQQPLVVAYEPVWAIGTGLSATPEQAQQVHQRIRQCLLAHFDQQQIAQQIPLLYGGSVNANNAQQLLSQPQIDGALVGGASLDAEHFFEIICSTG